MISIIDTNGERAYNITEFLADTEADLAKIPKFHPGDMVYIADTGERKILSSKGIWEPLVDEIGG